jgi:hypothetical protein
MTSDILWASGERTTFDMPSFTELMEGQDGPGEDKFQGIQGLAFFYESKGDLFSNV